ncbi:MAG: hypothetical protein NTW19_21595 [Planctomycetota bacterium]|nr:hypothetical protein [Planctomycetota bacterium]
MPTKSPAKSPSLLWKGKTARVAIPPTRDPFINSLMTRLTPDKNGLERFFVTTYNSISGCLAVCINEAGEHRSYRFHQKKYGATHAGFYGVVQEDDDTLWLCGTIDNVSRLTLSTGKLETYETGAPSALIFQGLTFDKPTGKLLGIAFPPPKTTAFVFDTRTRKGVKVIETAQGVGNYMRYTVPNKDGTWTIVMHMPGNHLFIWDPRTDALDPVTITPTYESENFDATTYMVITDDAGRIYFPGKGWFDPVTKQYGEGPRPQSERTWFGRIGDHAWGVSASGGNVSTFRWDMKTGKVSPVAPISDCSAQGVNLTASGKIVSVNLYGEFHRFDAMTGALECSRRLDADGVGHIDTMCLLDDRRLLGTPFITQRFWEADLKTGKGADMGRAAPGYGEIMQLRKIGKKVYLAAYAGGELTEYDPAQPARYPENPRTVADPPLAMRPVAIDTDGRILYWSSSREYGKLGCIIARYDTRTGLSTYVDSPLGDQMVTSLFYERKTDSLLVATTIHADCQSCPATADRACLARLDAKTLKPVERVDAPKGVEHSTIVGPLAPGKWVACWNRPNAGKPWFVVESGAMKAPAPAPGESESATKPWPVEKVHSVHYAGSPGKFLIHAPGQLGVWDLRKAPGKLLRELPIPALKPGSHIHRLFVQDATVMFNTAEEVFVLRDALKGI